MPARPDIQRTAAEPTDEELAGGMFCAGSCVLVAYLIVLTILAFVLQAACSWCDVPTPEFKQAMGITFAVHVGTTIVQAGLYFSVGEGGALFSIPVAVGVAALVYSAMLHVSFLKGVLLYFAQLIILAVLVFAVAFVGRSVLLEMAAG